MKSQLALLPCAETKVTSRSAERVGKRTAAGKKRTARQQDINTERQQDSKTSIQKDSKTGIQQDSNTRALVLPTFRPLKTNRVYPAC